jgi:predicted PurR-regulated permease PerM
MGIVFYELRMFLPSFLGAYTLYILLRRPMFYLTVVRKWNKQLVTLMLILATVLVLILPAQALVRTITNKLLPYLQNSQDIYAKLDLFVQDLEKRFAVELLSEENIANARDWLVKEGGIVLSATLNSIAIFMIMYFLLYYMLMYGREMERRLTDLLPMDEKVSQSLKRHMNSMVFSNAIGVPMVAFFQSLVAMIGYLIAGVDEPVLWTTMTFITSFVPMVGSMIIYVPLSILLIYGGATGHGIFLLFYCFLIVGSVDNVFRFWLQKKIGDTHPLITIFGVIVGLKLFGFLGLIFGPILISSLILLIKLYSEQYRTQDGPDGAV